ncbi:cation diffusion facilitator family transporter [Salinibacillus xinjiangensis]|uniref:Cation diffusion facilitator family transporter n=1 Tax=Salinibacillus xinjiangensis TaxID=1229268 RepID=A0A6G1X7P5_9BACI|nr:cation diffusion facilitator family transporter [Salinibacillus xinjiangensis]MRG86828.1 cation diffusion facilitator family transporter [Salinibacillus xinjiangensis]
MGHSHGHNHDHGHSHGANKKALLISFVLIGTFMVVEVIGGIITNSLALISDAGHMLSDAAALGLSLLAFKMGEKAANASKTYGYKRFEILAAFINGITLLAISIYIFWEAYHRFLEPPQVGSGMMIVATIGLIVNLVVAWILMKGDTSGNINMRSAFLHVMGDLLGSIGAIVAGLLILIFDWNIADPIASVLVSFLILVSGWRVTKDSVHVLMEGKPSHIDLKQVETKLKSLPGVIGVHDLHVWTITSDFPTLTCHVIVEQQSDRDDLLQTASKLMHEEFELKHTTIQIEGEGSKFHETEENCN